MRYLVKVMEADHADYELNEMVFINTRWITVESEEKLSIPELKAVLEPKLKVAIITVEESA